MSDKTRIFISRTEHEWKLIDKRIKELGFRSFSRFLNSRLVLLHKDYQMHPVQVGKSVLVKTKKRQSVIPPSIPTDFLDEISSATGVAPSTIIDRIIVSPLLNT